VQYNETMAVSAWYAVVFVGIAACSPYGGGAFHCERDDQCTGGGTCQQDGLCSFSDPGCPSGQRYGDLADGLSNSCVMGGGGIDAAMQDGPADDGSIDAMIDGPPPAPFCDAANEPALVGCWAFEGNTNDASGDNNNATTVNNASFATGKVGMGLVLQANSLVAVPDSASLTSAAISVEAFIRPTALPTAGTRMGIIDNDGQYGLFLIENAVQCVFGLSVTAPQVPINQFTHIGCTYDGATVSLYINGALVVTATGGAPLGAGNANGTVIGGNSPNGDQLIGMIDQMRVWNTARTAQQICAASGAAVCP
jgi:concanavalin A-like lectin/glucanase superfamily protein